MINLHRVCLFLVVLFLSGCGGSSTKTVNHACKLSGQVVKVVDGDTADVLDAAKVQHKIRFAGIDAPERNQPFGKVSKQFVSKLIAGKTVCVDYQKADHWGRLIGVILIDGRDVNLEVIKVGLAWHYKRYQKEQRPADRQWYAQAEANARINRLGLWADEAVMAPWEWRKR